MSDNTALEAVSATGDIARTLEDSLQIKWPVSVIAYATTIGTPNVLEEVTPAAPLPVGGNTAADGSGTLVPFLVDAAGNLQIDVVGALPSGSNNIGSVFDRPTTSGGLSMHKTVSAASTNGTSVKASAGQVYAIQVMNLNAAARYVKLYNKATAPTVGTDTPVKTLLIPGNTAGAGLVLNWDKGLTFALGIGFGITTGITDADTGAVAANEIVVNMDYV